MNRKLWMAVCVGVAAGTAMMAMKALAQDNKPPITASFDSLDANKDGRISASEARKDKGVEARFAAGDTNQDGYLDREEFKVLASK